MKRKQRKKAVACLLLTGMLFGCGGAEERQKTVTQKTETEQMRPVYAEELEDGQYFIDVDSSSSMFRAVSTVLTVENGEMTAAMTLSGQGYLKLFLGTGEEALKAEEADFYYFEEGEDGAYTYTIPVEALNQEFDCAAWSIRREQWYDRVLVIEADSLRPWVADGEYPVEVTLEGGTGRSEILSPATLKLKKGQMTARIEWDSPFYDYMIVDFIKYYPVNAEGNSVFEIPVKALDRELKVVADTVAMSTPHEIEYTLTFHSEGLQ